MLSTIQLDSSPDGNEKGHCSGLKRYLSLGKLDHKQAVSMANSRVDMRSDIFGSTNKSIVTIAQKCCLHESNPREISSSASEFSQATESVAFICLVSPPNKR